MADVSDAAHKKHRREGKQPTQTAMPCLRHTRVRALDTVSCHRHAAHPLMACASFRPALVAELPAMTGWATHEPWSCHRASWANQCAARPLHGLPTGPRARRLGCSGSPAIRCRGSCSSPQVRRVLLPQVRRRALLHHDHPSLLGVEEPTREGIKLPTRSSVCDDRPDAPLENPTSNAGQAAGRSSPTFRQKGPPRRPEAVLYTHGRTPVCRAHAPEDRHPEAHGAMRKKYRYASPWPGMACRMRRGRSAMVELGPSLVERAQFARVPMRIRPSCGAKFEIDHTFDRC